MTSPSKWSPLKRPFTHKVTSADSSPVKRVEFSDVSVTTPAQQQPAQNGSVTSLESPQQCLYDSVSGCYSPHARGYPHGHINCTPNAPATESTSNLVSPVKTINNQSCHSSQPNVTNGNTMLPSNSFSHQNGFTEPAAVSHSHNLPKQLCVPVFVTSHDESVLTEVVSCKCGGAPLWQDSLRNKNRSVEPIDDDLASRSDDTSDCDDVSCTDSEPFMTQVVDLDSPSVSPMCHIKQSSLFVQESHV